MSEGLNILYRVEVCWSVSHTKVSLRSASASQTTTNRNRFQKPQRIRGTAEDSGERYPYGISSELEHAYHPLSL